MLPPSVASDFTGIIEIPLLPPAAPPAAEELPAPAAAPLKNVTEKIVVFRKSLTPCPPTLSNRLGRILPPWLSLYSSACSFLAWRPPWVETMEIRCNNKSGWLYRFAMAALRALLVRRWASPSPPTFSLMLSTVGSASLACIALWKNLG